MVATKEANAKRRQKRKDNKPSKCILTVGSNPPVTWTGLSKNQIESETIDKIYKKHMLKPNVIDEDVDVDDYNNFDTHSNGEYEEDGENLKLQL